MEIILTVLSQALDNNISYAILMDVVLFFLFGINIILGTIIGTKESHFDVKKFFFGVLKALVIMISIVAICYIVNVFTLTINLIEGITISESFVTTMEILAILITMAGDLIKEITEKLKNIKSLKYTSYDNIIISDTNIIEPTELKG